MTKHYYKYYVSFCYEWQPKLSLMGNKSIQTKFSSVIIDCDTMIEEIEDVDLIMNTIKNVLNSTIKIVGNVIIISFHLMKEFDKEMEESED
jgi:predicted secreted protein